MNTHQMPSDGFLSSSTKTDPARWTPPRDVRKRLIALGWPFAAAFGTKIISDAFDLMAFMATHRRIPNYRKSGYLNDYLFHIKRTRENLALRRATTDKYLAKSFLKDLFGAEYTVPTLGIISNRDALKTYQFPLKSVVKPTHMSGSIYLCGTRQPSAAERSKMQSWFDIDFGLVTGEWHYHGLEPKVIVEPFLPLNNGASNDLRLYVYEGRVRVVELYSGRYGHGTLDYFDCNWNRMAGLRATMLPLSDEQPTRPQRLSCMVRLAERIGKEFSLVRVDFFTDFADRFYIGELTHITGNCRGLWDPPAAERYFLMGGQ